MGWESAVDTLLSFLLKSRQLNCSILVSINSLKACLLTRHSPGLPDCFQTRSKLFILHPVSACGVMTAEQKFDDIR